MSTDIGGRKDDKGKLRYDLLPVDAVEEVVRILTYGANKYGDRNWEQGISYGRVFAATLRHLMAWWKRESIDHESCLLHLAHAACNILFLISYERRLACAKFDDRPDTEKERVK